MICWNSDIEKEYRGLYNATNDIIDQKEHTVFPTRAGSRFDSGILIIGRCTNGWENYKISNEEEFTNAAENQVNSQVICYFNNSAFWRVSKKIWEHYKSDNTTFEESIAWGNLYKIAPNAAGNPNYTVMKAQFESCKKLLKKEIDLLNPKCVLIITGWEGWIRFRYRKEIFSFEDLFDLKNTIPSNIVNHCGYFKDVPVVFANRPEFKKESVWTDEVISALDSLIR